MEVKYLMLSVCSLFFLSMKQCSKTSGEHKISVVGTGIHIMHRVGVETDARKRYYLVVNDQDQDRWIDKYGGKRIKVTGILVPRKDTIPMPYNDSTYTLQPNIRDGDTIRNATWKIVE